MTGHHLSVKAQSAENAFQAHAALLKAERDDRLLRRNPYWSLLRQDGYERFALAFEAIP